MATSVIPNPVGSLFKIKWYGCQYSLNGYGATSITPTQLNASTPDGYTPFCTRLISTGHNYVFVYQVWLTAGSTGGMVALANFSSATISNAQLQIEVVYIRSDAVS